MDACNRVNDSIGNSVSLERVPDNRSGCFAQLALKFIAANAIRPCDTHCP